MKLYRKKQVSVIIRTTMLHTGTSQVTKNEISNIYMIRNKKFIENEFI